MGAGSESRARTASRRARIAHLREPDEGQSAHVGERIMEALHEHWSGLRGLQGDERAHRGHAEKEVVRLPGRLQEQRERFLRLQRAERARRPGAQVAGLLKAQPHDLLLAGSGARQWHRNAWPGLEKANEERNGPLVLLFPELLDGLAAHDRVQPCILDHAPQQRDAIRRARERTRGEGAERGLANPRVRVIGRSENGVARRRVSDLPQRVERGRPHPRRFPRRLYPLAESGNGFAVSPPAEAYRRGFTDRGQRILQQDQESVSDLCSSPARERLDEIEPLRFRKARVLRLNRQSLEGRTGVGQRRAPARRRDNRDEDKGQNANPPVIATAACLILRASSLVREGQAGPSRPNECRQHRNARASAFVKQRWEDGGRLIEMFIHATFRGRSTKNGRRGFPRRPWDRQDYEKTTCRPPRGESRAARRERGYRLSRRRILVSIRLVRLEAPAV